MLLKSGSWVSQGHRKWHHSIACIWVSYYRPIVTLCLKCTVFEIWRHTGWKSPKNLPDSHLARSLVVTPCEFFDESYLARKWNHGAIRWCTFHDSRSARHNTGCDRQTDRWTRRCRKDRAMHNVAWVKICRCQDKAESFAYRLWVSRPSTNVTESQMESVLGDRPIPMRATKHHRLTTYTRANIKNGEISKLLYAV